MTDLPQPDLRDQRGRMNRLVLALAVAAVLAIGAYLVCTQLTAGAHDNPYNWKGGPTRFVWSTTGLAGAIGFVVTLAVANARAKKKWRDGLVAKAQVKS